MNVATLALLLLTSCTVPTKQPDWQWMGLSQGPSYDARELEKNR